MPIAVYPPSHRDTRAPQPEVCDLCGLSVPAHQLVESDVEGLRGLHICPFCHDGMRDRLSYDDRRRLNPIDYDVIGTGRVYPPGATQEFWNPAAELFSPAHIARPALWLRNFSIPTDEVVTRWPGGLAYSPGVTLATGFPEPMENPFGFGARGVRMAPGPFGDSFSLETTLEFADAFTIALALRTGPSLSGAVNLLHEDLGGSSRLEILADGSLVLGTTSTSHTLLAAGSFTVSTNYVLVVQRDAAWQTYARKNAVAGATVSALPPVVLGILHDAATTTLILAELVVYSQTLSARELTCLESYLGGYVGVDT